MAFMYTKLAKQTNCPENTLFRFHYSIEHTFKLHQERTRFFFAFNHQTCYSIPIWASRCNSNLPLIGGKSLHTSACASLDYVLAPPHCTLRCSRKRDTQHYLWKNRSVERSEAFYKIRKNKSLCLPLPYLLKGGLRLTLPLLAYWDAWRGRAVPGHRYCPGEVLPTPLGWFNGGGDKGLVLDGGRRRGEVSEGDVQFREPNFESEEE